MSLAGMLGRAEVRSIVWGNHTSAVHRPGEKTGTRGQVIGDPPEGRSSVLGSASTARDQHNHSADQRQRPEDRR
jgi:hypothetical protein